MNQSMEISTDVTFYELDTADDNVILRQKLIRNMSNQKKL